MIEAWDNSINRTSVSERFKDHLSTTNYVLNIKGQNEWVDNYIKFGDLISEHMGEDACAFYYEQLYDLLLTIENDGHSEEDKITEEVSIITPKPAPKTKSNKQNKPMGKRLF